MKHNMPEKKTSHSWLKTVIGLVIVVSIGVGIYMYVNGLTSSLMNNDSTKPADEQTGGATEEGGVMKTVSDNMSSTIAGVSIGVILIGMLIAYFLYKKGFSSLKSGAKKTMTTVDEFASGAVEQTTEAAKSVSGSVREFSNKESQKVLESVRRKMSRKMSKGKNKVDNEEERVLEGE